MATPLGLMAMGATFDIRKAFAKVKPAVAASMLKLVGFTAIFLPLAVMLGFRREELVAILVMLGSATTVSCFVMAKNMGHEGVFQRGDADHAVQCVYPDWVAVYIEEHGTGMIGDVVKLDFTTSPIKFYFKIY